MNEADKIISILYDIYGVSNDNQLSKELGLKSNSSISNWRKSGIIPEKYKNKCSNFMSTNEHLEANLVTINLYEDIQASAGYGANNEDIVPAKLQFDKNFLRQFFNITRFDNLDIIRVVGDSMLPAIKDGEYIIVERCLSARNGDTVIANIDGELYVKRLYKIPLEQWVRLESENDSYPPIELNTPEKLEAFRIVGIVKSKIKLY
jgi:phage repressor protein C with HTH and peptisase S24 domain